MTAVTATYRHPTLPVLETHFSSLKNWLRDWTIAINVLTKTTALPFVKASRRLKRPRPEQFFGEPVQWIHAARRLGATMHTQLTLSRHTIQVGKKVAQGLACWALSLTEVVCPSCAVFCCISSYSALRWSLRSPAGDRCSHRRLESALCTIHKSMHYDSALSYVEHLRGFGCYIFRQAHQSTN